MTTSIVDVVRHAGGWLFDQAMAGWEVTALVTTQQDVRPLQILGVKVVELETTLVGPPRCPAALGVTTEIYLADDRVRYSVRRALKGGWPEVTFWGKDLPNELGHRVTPQHHQLSSAARIFKGYALAAAAVPNESVEVVERFCAPVHNPRTGVGPQLRSLIL